MFYLVSGLVLGAVNYNWLYIEVGRYSYLDFYSFQIAQAGVYTTVEFFFLKNGRDQNNMVEGLLCLLTHHYPTMH